jgi:von Willebrand factor A domain-containing protein 8
MDEIWSCPDVARAFRWLSRKDELEQDMFLIGEPLGGFKRALALEWCRRVGRKVCYVSLTHDTTDSDLKQRKELVDGSVCYVDQAVVKAALFGHVLVIEGLERCERNVLPVINNLIENREMLLDDGRFLIDERRFASIQATNNNNNSNSNKKESSLLSMRATLAPIDRRFRVIAIGLPIPPYTGMPLDPPLRSRFQAIRINPLPTPTLLAAVLAVGESGVDARTRRRLVELAVAMRSLRARVQLPAVADLPLLSVVRIPHRVSDVASLFVRAWGPHLSEARALLGDDAAAVADELLSHYGTDDGDSGARAQVVQSLACGANVLLVGERGIGKTRLVESLGGAQDTLYCYKDLMARDLLCRRTTNSDGDTVWQRSPLAEAIVSGRLLVLDGVDQLAAGTLQSLCTLLQDRHIELPGGDVPAVHARFRLVATAAPPTRANAWLSAEVAQLFHSVSMGTLSAERIECVLLDSAIDGLDAPLAAKLARFAELSRQRAQDPLAELQRAPFTLRALIRLAKRVTAYGEDIDGVLRQVANVTRFWSAALRDEVLHAVHDSGLAAPRTLQQLMAFGDGNDDDNDADEAVSIRVDADASVAHFGDALALERREPTHAELVPAPFYVDIARHSVYLREMAKDFALGEHLLLVAPQGVGKNVLTDRLLQLLNAEREYLQLHRESSVQSITAAVTLVDRKVTLSDDSPLVRAMRYGRVLVIDEVDKANVDVLLALKSLLHERRILLADGRRFGGADGEPIHAAFRVIALANPPQLPFLGNDFHAEISDAFALHSLANPDMRSEVALLRGYAPTVPVEVLRSLSMAFGELRSMCADGQLSYPISTRELIQCCRHLERFPDDPLHVVLDNIFAFDSFDDALLKLIGGVFHRHGVPFGGGGGAASSSGDVDEAQVSLAEAMPLPAAAAPRAAFTLWRDSDAFYRGAAYRARLSSPTAQPLALFAPMSHERPLESTVAESARVEWQPVVDGAHSSRVLGFGEEIARVNLDRRRTGAPVASLADADNCAVHMLCVGPFELLSYRLRSATSSAPLLCSRRPLTPAIVSYCQSDLFSPPAAPVMARLERANLIAIFECHYSVLLLVGACGDGTRRVFSLPLDNDRRQFDRYMDTGKSASVARVSDTALAFFLVGSNRIAIVDDQPAVRYIELAEQMRVARVDALHERRWLLRDVDGVQYELFFGADNDELSLRPLFCAHQNADIANLRTVDLQHTVVAKLDSGASWPALDSAHAAHAQNAQASSSSSSSFAIGAAKILGGYMCGWPGERVARVQPGAKLHLATVSVYARARATQRRARSSVSQWLGAHNMFAVARALEGGELVVELVDVRGGGEMRSFVVDTRAGDSVRLVGLHEFAAQDGTQCVALVRSDSVVHLIEVDGKQLESSLAAWRHMRGGGGGGGGQSQTEDDEEEGGGGGGEGQGGQGGQGSGGSGGQGQSGGADDEDPGDGEGGGDGGGGGGGGSFMADANIDRQFGEKKPRRRRGAKRFDVDDDSVFAKAQRAAEHALAKRLDPEKSRVNLDPSLYEQLRASVATQISSLRQVLQNTEAREQERVWLRHRVTGEIDEAKLVDGAAGERAVFRRRGAADPLSGAPQRLPKRLRFVVDLSSSMARFNGFDRRLDRLAACVIMIMEAFAGFEHKYEYSVVGHDGESAVIELVPWREPPKTERERFDIIERIYWNASFAMSGDHTLAALLHAIADTRAETADDYIVVLFSDCNLSSYGISSQNLRKALRADPSVHAVALFIAGDAHAQSLVASLPASIAHLVLDTTKLPAVFKKIFSSAIASNHNSHSSHSSHGFQSSL